MLDLNSIDNWSLQPQFTTFHYLLLLNSELMHNLPPSDTTNTPLFSNRTITVIPDCPINSTHTTSVFRELRTLQGPFPQCLRCPNSNQEGKELRILTVSGQSWMDGVIMCFTDTRNRVWQSDMCLQGSTWRRLLLRPNAFHLWTCIIPTSMYYLRCSTCQGLSTLDPPTEAYLIAATPQQRDLINFCRQNWWL